MTRDPIVEEIRRAREKLLDECGDDIEKFMDRLKSAEDEDRARLISYEALQDKRKRDREAI